MEQTTAAPKQYPESWDEHDQASQETDRRLKLKAGDTVRMKLISGPLTYREIYLETGKMTKTNKPEKKRIAVPFSAQLPGLKLKVQYMVEVLVLDGPMKGQNKIFTFGKQVADGLAAVKKVWGSVREPDIVINRVGATKDDTVYTATAAPSTVKASDIPVMFDLEAEVGFSKKEDLDKLPPPPTGGVQPELGAASPAQLDLIDSLAGQKKLTAKEVVALIDRKFGVKEVALLSSAQASECIDTLRNY
jgi:hypothetical protein